MTSIPISTPDEGPTYQSFHADIVELLQGARHAAARNVNALMTASYWEIGRRIVEFEQGGRHRARYGDSVLRRLATDLTGQFGRGFGWRNLTQMRNFYSSRQDHRILQTVSAKSPGLDMVHNSSAVSGDLPHLGQAFPLPWSAYVCLMSVNNTVLAAEYQTVLPDEKSLAAELDKTRRELDNRRVEGADSSA